MDKLLDIIKKNIGLKLLISFFLTMGLLVSYNITGYDILLKLMYIPIAYVSLIILIMVIYIIVSIINGK